ncbi:amino acid-binding protein, partial [Methanosarcinales archaeon]
HSDIRDLIDSIDSTGFAEVVKLSLEMPAIDMKSSASLTISAVNEDKLNEAMEILGDVARKKGIMMISPI